MKRKLVIYTIIVVISYAYVITVQKCLGKSTYIYELCYWKMWKVNDTINNKVNMLFSNLIIKILLHAGEQGHYYYS